MRTIYNISLALISIAALFACSSDDLAGAAQGAAQDSYVNANSDVEICINTPNLSLDATRAVQTGIIETYPVDLGVFMLARNILPDVTTSPTIDWNADAGTASVWMKNGFAIVNDATTGIHWQDDADDTEYKVRYYPYDDSFGYQFYAYHPRTEDVTYTSTKVTANYAFSDLNCRNDLIWGKASLPSDKTSDEYNYAYSAKYYHRGYNSTLSPSIELNHLFSRILVTVSRSNNTKDADVISVQSISITNAPQTVQLVIADKKNANNEGKLTLSGSASCLMQRYVDNDYVDMTAFDVVKGTDVTGQFMLPHYTSYEPYKLKIEYTANGEKFEATTDLTVKDAAGDDARYLNPGTKYNLNISVGTPTAIVLTASLQEWDESGSEKVLY